VTIWLDNHLSPALAGWIETEFGEPAVQIRDLGLARADDADIFRQARTAARILITKDRDFAELVLRLGAPPAIILLALGNTSTAHLRSVLQTRLPMALELATRGEPLIEIAGE